MSQIDPVMFDCKVLENFSCQATFMVCAFQIYWCPCAQAGVRLDENAAAAVVESMGIH